jgi:hypothetical protein
MIRKDQLKAPLWVGEKGAVAFKPPPFSTNRCDCPSHTVKRNAPACIHAAADSQCDSTSIEIHAFAKSHSFRIFQAIQRHKMTFTNLLTAVAHSPIARSGSKRRLPQFWNPRRMSLGEVPQDCTNLILRTSDPNKRGKSRILGLSDLDVVAVPDSGRRRGHTQLMVRGLGFEVFTPKNGVSSFSG